MHHVLFIAACLIWGASFVLMKKAHDALGPLSIAAWRCAFGAATLAAIWCLSRPRPRKYPREPGVPAVREGSVLTRRDLPWLLIPGVLGIAYPWAMQPYLIGHYQASGFFGMMVSLVPLLTIAVSIPMLGVLPSRRELLGVLGGLACLAVLFDDGQHRGITAVSFALAASVPLSYAISNTFIKRRLSHVPSEQMSLIVLAIAAMVLLPMGLSTERIEPGADGWTLVAAVAAVAFLGVFGAGLAVWIIFYLVQRRGPLFAGMTTYGVSSLAVAWGWVDAERVTPTQVGALAGVLAMVALVQWPGRKAAARPSPSSNQPA